MLLLRARLRSSHALAFEFGHRLCCGQALLKPLVSKVAELPDLGTVPVLVEILDAVLYQWEEAPKSHVLF